MFKASFRRIYEGKEIFINFHSDRDITDAK